MNVLRVNVQWFLGIINMHGLYLRQNGLIVLLLGIRTLKASLAHLSRVTIFVASSLEEGLLIDHASI